MMIQYNVAVSLLDDALKVRVYLVEYMTDIRKNLILHMCGYFVYIAELLCSYSAFY